MGQGLISKRLCSASGSKNIWTGIVLEYMTQISLVICSRVSKNGVCKQINTINICACIHYSPLYVLISVHFLYRCEANVESSKIFTTISVIT